MQLGSIEQRGEGNLENVILRVFR